MLEGDIIVVKLYKIGVVKDNWFDKTGKDFTRFYLNNINTLIFSRSSCVSITHKNPIFAVILVSIGRFFWIYHTMSITDLSNV